LDLGSASSSSSILESTVFRPPPTSNRRFLVYSRGLHLDAVILNHPHSFNLWRWKERDDHGRRQRRQKLFSLTDLFR
jgi:hypothetical protein